MHTSVCLHLVGQLSVYESCVSSTAIDLDLAVE